MSLVVTANTTFLSGLSWASPAAPQMASRTPMIANPVTMRFIEDPLFPGRGPARQSRADGLVGLRPEDDVLLHRLHDEVKGHPHHGEQNEHREDARDVQGEVELKNQVAQPLLRPHELAHDGAQDAEDDGDVEAREDEGQRIGKGHEPEGLPAAGPERPHEIELGGIYGLESYDHVHEHGEEGHGGGDDDLGGNAEA